MTRYLARLTAIGLQPWLAWSDLVREEVGNLAVERIEAKRPRVIPCTPAP